MADQRRSGVSRGRVVAGTVLVLLILTLFGLGYALTKVIEPPGAPQRGSLAEGMTWVRSIYGFGPRADQQLLQPIGVAIDKAGRIYVSEPQRSRVVVFNRDGGFDGLIKLMQSKDIGMVRPGGLAVDDAGNLYVADKDLHRVIVFDPAHKFIRNIKDDVTAVTVKGDRLYALGREHVSIYTLEGRLISRFGKMGREPGKFDGVNALTVGNDGLLYVLESFNRRVSVYKPDGEFVRAIGQPASKTSAAATPTTTPAKASKVTSEVVFDLPTGLVLDSNGRLVSVDAFLFQLAVFDTTGRTSGTYGEQGTADGAFIYPSGLAYDPNGDVFAVTDTMNNRVQILRLEGSGSARLDRRVPAQFMQPTCYGPFALLLLAVVLIVVASRRRSGERGPEGAPLGD